MFGKLFSLINLNDSQMDPSADSPSLIKTCTFLFLFANALPTATVIPKPKLPVEQYIPFSSSLCGCPPCFKNNSSASLPSYFLKQHTTPKQHVLKII
jgi:hypothetical protein